MRRLASIVAIGAVAATCLAPTTSAGLLVTANDDAYSVSHDQVLSIAAPGLLANDTGVAPTAAKLTNPAHGTVTVNASGSFTYHPAGGYVGSDSFTYEARVLNLGTLVTDPATVAIDVTNAAPVAADDSYVASTGVSLKVTPPGVLGNDTDADGDKLKAILVSGGGNGSFSLAADGGFTYKSGGSFVGILTFTYRVSDGITTSALATITIDVRPKGTTPPPTPTPTPVPTPTPAPTRTPSPTPTPTLPLPSLPLPSLPSILPTPTPQARPTPAPTSTDRPGPSAEVGASQPPAASAMPSAGASAPDASAVPGASADPRTTPPGSSLGPGSGAGGSTSGAGAGSNSGPAAGGASGDGPPAVGPAGPASIAGLTDVDVVGMDGLVTWAVPSLALSVPGILLVLAVLAQTLGATAWLPVVRRWLGGFGFGRRRRDREGATG